MQSCKNLADLAKQMPFNLLFRASLTSFLHTFDKKNVFSRKLSLILLRNLF